GHVQHGHSAHFNNHYLYLGREATQHAERFFRRAKEQWSANGVGTDPLGQVLQGRMETARQAGGVGQVAHALDEQSSSQQQANADCQHHVEQHSEHQAGKQHQHIAARCYFDRMHHMACLTHVPRDHQQQGGQRGHGQVAEQRREQQDSQQDYAAVNNGRQRREGAGAYVGGGTRNRRCGGDTAEQGSDQIADALAEQFGVGVMLGASHAVGYHRTEQRFDGAQHGNSEGGGHQLANQFKGQRQRLTIRTRQVPGQGKGGQKRRDARVFDTVEGIAEAFAESGQRQADAFQKQAEQRAYQ